MSDREGAEAGPAPSVTPAQLEERLRAGEPFSVLDVRDRDEFEAWHIEGGAVTASQVPHVRFVGAEVTGGAAELVEDLPEPVVVVCGHGEASAHAAELLVAAGVDAANLAGGMDAWAGLYRAVDLRAGESRVRQYRRPSSGCLSYLVVSDGEAAAVDPLRAFVDRYAADARELGAELRYAVDTHVHADHVSGVAALAGATGATAVFPTGARERGLALEARTVADGEALPLGGTTLTARALPGHTTEMTGLDLGDVWLTGDTLFLESVARPDLQRGADGAPELARRLYDSLHGRLLALDPGTLVAPGHYGGRADPDAEGRYVATVGGLRERLALLDLDEAAFVERVLGDMPPRPANYERIIEVNLGRAAAGEEVLELELGPNNCAVG